MAEQIINVGTTANDGTGDTVRVAFQKSKANFSELYHSWTATFIIDKVGSTIYASPKPGLGLTSYSGSDAHTVIQAAYTNMASVMDGGHIHLTDGMYSLTDMLLFSAEVSNFKLTGSTGAFIVPVAGFTQSETFVHIAETDNVFVDGINIIGNGLIAIPALDDHDNGMHGIYVLNSENVTVQNCNLTKQPKAGILIENCTNVRLLYNNIPATYNYGIWVIGGDDALIRGNVISGQGAAQHDGTTLGLALGILVTTTDRVIIESNNLNDFKNTGTKTEGCNYVTYDKNIVRNCGKDGLKIEPFSGDTIKYARITNNTVEYLHPWATDAGGLIMLWNCEEFVVTGNIIKGGIRGDADGGTETGISINHNAGRSKKGIVSNNVLNDIGRTGIYVENADDITISSNYVKNYGIDLDNVYGIWCAGTPTLIKIDNNKILLPAGHAAVAGQGIAVGNSAIDISITNNELVNTIESAIGVNAGAANYIDISGNKITNTGSSAILLQGSGVCKVVKTDNNIISGTIGSGGAAGIMYLRSAAITDASAIGNTFNTVGATACFSFQSAVTKWTEQGNTISGSAVLPTYSTPPTLIQHSLYHFRGTGSPESVVTAGIGAIYLRSDGSTSTTLYVKTSGSGNTGWTAK